MATRKFTPTVQIFLMGVLCMVFLLSSGVQVEALGPNPLVCIGHCSKVPNCNQTCIDKAYHLGGSCTSISGSPLSCCCESAELLVNQGLCSKFPDCNKTCLDLKFPAGGKCIQIAPRSALFCVCIMPN